MSVSETTPQRAAPVRPNQGPVAWLRANLFSTWYNSLLTLLIAGLLVLAMPGIIDWALVRASWTGDAAACREAGGACWAFLVEIGRASCRERV